MPRLKAVCPPYFLVFFCSHALFFLLSSLPSPSSWALTATAASTSPYGGNQCYVISVLEWPFFHVTLFLTLSTVFASQMALESVTFLKNQSRTLMRMYNVAPVKSSQILDGRGKAEPFRKINSQQSTLSVPTQQCFQK